MQDEYTGKGGRYSLDPKTGVRTPVAATKPAPRQNTVSQETVKKKQELAKNAK